MATGFRAHILVTDKSARGEETIGEQDGGGEEADGDPHWQILS
jgi:hypothetical protein